MDTRMMQYHVLRLCGCSSYEAKRIALHYKKEPEKHEKDHKDYAREHMRERRARKAT